MATILTFSTQQYATQHIQYTRTDTVSYFFWLDFHHKYIYLIATTCRLIVSRKITNYRKTRRRHCEEAIIMRRRILKMRKRINVVLLHCLNEKERKPTQNQKTVRWSRMKCLWSNLVNKVFHCTSLIFQAQIYRNEMLMKKR